MKMATLEQLKASIGKQKIFCLVCGMILSALLLATVFGALAPSPAYAQEELVTVNVEGVSKAETPLEAAREIQAKATTDAAREQVIELVGDKRYQKSKAQIESKIVRQAVKFIPFVNPGQPVKQPDGSWKMNVEMKISSASLRKMVLEAGFLSDAEGPASILPMIAFTDRTKSISTRWWLGEEKDEAHKFVVQMGRSVHEKLLEEFNRQGFHMIRPLGTQSSPLPELYRVERPSAQELKAISDYYQAPMVARGDVRVREAREVPNSFSVSVKLQVVQASSGRLIAEVSRAFDTDSGNLEAVVRNKLNSELPEIAKDLAVQVLEAWQRGTINANLVRLAVRGNLSPKQMNDFKNSLMRSVREVKSLRERMFEPGQVTFEVDYAGRAPQLAERLKAAELAGFTASVAEASDEGLVLQIKTR